MVCLHCHGPLQVINSRAQKTTNNVWRRRSCKQCDNVFTSIEKIDLTTSLRVKRSEGLEPFFREKLFMSVYKSIEHKKKALQQAHDITEHVCAELMLHHAPQAVVDPAAIASITTKILKRFDAVAGLHYEALHK